MKVLGNIIWFILVGLWNWLYYTIIGLLLCITIIGIPLGRQCFKLAHLIVFPFGKTIKTNFGVHPFANIFWMIIFGWEYAIYMLIVGLILCITIIGIPFGRQCFKLMQLGLMPFGANVD